jgi:hypothetical protein
MYPAVPPFIHCFCTPVRWSQPITDKIVPHQTNLFSTLLFIGAGMEIVFVYSAGVKYNKVLDRRPFPRRQLEEANGKASGV